MNRNNRNLGKGVISSIVPTIRPIFSINQNCIKGISYIIEVILRETKFIRANNFDFYFDLDFIRRTFIDLVHCVH